MKALVLRNKLPSFCSTELVLIVLVVVAVVLYGKGLGPLVHSKFMSTLYQSATYMNMEEFYGRPNEFEVDEPWDGESHE